MSADSNGRAWDWLDDADDVVVPEQPPVAVYTNPKGAVVVRQRGDDRDDGDAWIWFAPEHARAIASAIIEAAGCDVARCDIADLAPEPAQGDGKPMASTAAERQKRYRDRKKKEPALFDSDERNVTEGESVTSRDGTKT